MKVMKYAKFVTSKETDPFFAICLNTRFNAFLARLAAKRNIEDFEAFVADAREILEDAEIPQD